jgi:hypothetical protein
MSAAFNVFLNDLAKFTEASLTWCVTESEKSTSYVTDTVSLILSDTERVSKISKESIDAISAIKKSVHSKALDKSMARDLMTTLTRLCDDHHELKSVIEPIIHTLQFQDRFRQNLENAYKMLGIWCKERDALSKLPLEEAKLKLATKFLGCTTMKEEREILKKHVPNLQLPVEKADEVTFF